MKNLTVTLDAKTLAWARREAAAREISLSRFVGDLLQSRMLASRNYDVAMNRYLARGPVSLGRAGKRYPRRDELHDRARLR